MYIIIYYLYAYNIKSSLRIFDKQHTNNNFVLNKISMTHNLNFLLIISLVSLN